MLLLLLACLPELDPKDSGTQETGTVLDADGDGYPEADDCDDTNPDVYPGADELCNGVDDDCDGVTPADELDADEDGVAECEGDCDDSRADVYPDAPEPCDFADNDCDGDIDEEGLSVFYGDSDQDGYGDPAVASEETCGAPDGYVANDQDCDDANAQANPGLDELCSTDFDDDCDGTVNEDDAADAPTWYADADADAFGTPNYTQVQCLQPEGYVADGTDCDDTEATVHPGADEVCNRVDDDCDGQVPAEETDDDSDGVSECEGDCDDGDASVIVPTWYLDSDSDGYGGSASVDDCTAPNGYVDNADDCDDGDDTVNPGASEVCDGQDNDCDNAVPSDETDDDSDGYVECTLDSGGWDGSGTKAGDDCDDTDSGINPGADETCDGSTDEDCDGSVDESTAIDASTWYADSDSDSYGDASSTTVACDQPSNYVSDDTDCDDGDSTTYPGASEVCGDGVLNDCNATTTDECGPWDAWALGDAQAIVRGDNAGDEAGRHVAGGDIDADGTNDLIVAADAGTYLFLGPLTADTTLGSADVAITAGGTKASPTWVGWSEDLTGDNSDDLLIGDSANGLVYVMEGPLTADADVTDAVADFDMESTWSAGWTVQAGDTDADGTLDISISGPGFGYVNRTDAGGVAIWLGPVSGSYTFSSLSEVSTNRPDGFYYGPSDSFAGYSTGFQDLDSDGSADLVVGAPLTTAGTVYIVLGSVTNSSYSDLATASDASLTGASSGNTFGTHLAIGDHNGDGYPDLAVGDEEADSARGYAYIFNGSATGFASTTAASADASVRGPSPGYLSPVALDGDVNDDGYDDLLTAAPSNPANGKGRVYFFAGPLTGTLYAASSRDGVWTGEASGDNAGENALGYAGDTDGDGFDDSLVGAYQQDTNGTSSGAVYLMLGGENY